MAASRSRTLLFIAVPVMILLLPFSIYFADITSASERIARNVTITGVDVSGDTKYEAIATVNEYTGTLETRSILIDVNGTTFEIMPSEIGLSFNTEDVVNEALGLRKDGIMDWFGSFREEIDLPVTASLDQELVTAKLIEWEQETIANPAFNGSIDISNGSVTYEYPRSGDAIVKDTSSDLLLASVQIGGTDTVVIPVVATEPMLTVADIDEGVKRAETIIERGVVLTNSEYGFEFSVSSYVLGRSLAAEITSDDSVSIEFMVKPTLIYTLVETNRMKFEVDASDAYWEIVLVDDFEDYDDQYEIKDSPQDDMEGLPEDDTIVLVPSFDKTTVDASDVAVAVENAALGSGVGELPINKVERPEFTTEMAQSYGELYELGEFTTWTPGTNRVSNIHLMADIVDWSIVMPDEVFSVNETVGKRTLEKGFKYDCAILGGEVICEEEEINIGGGVSQFGTTIFNAIYFSCLEDVTHRPHSIYFSKYPEGREATLGYPTPDVAFKNDTQAPVIIRTSYTNRSISVTLFGNNGGITCGTFRGERYDEKEPYITYRADEEGVVPPATEFISNEGSVGWRIVNTRIFYDSDGNEFDREDFYWTYRGARTVILMHPCEEMVGGDGVCPIDAYPVIGMNLTDATNYLVSAGLVVNSFETLTPDQTLDGAVAAITPEGFHELGVLVTLEVWKWDGTPPPSTTTTSTTTTTAAP